ncbi:3248_t:CDS:2 [Dentiscutata erythropus]|uniref:3248_t:CDS:1 n=1 Tax=Dentiscutata erythropus TaxID=1348616 RepID=A0A9N9H424_9GLOM|nr:3248_t:CDS:2 [Dentiscutata erythropus]
MPIPPENSSNIYNEEDALNQLIRKKRSYNITKLEHELSQNLLLLNENQHVIFNVIIQAIECEESQCFFVDGPELSSNIVIAGQKLSDLIDFTYSDFTQHSTDINYLIERTILTSKNDDATDSVDSQEDSNDRQSHLYSPEFLRSVKISGFPPGELKLKIRISIMLLRNLSLAKGLCNGTRLICHNLYNKVINAEICTGLYIGTRVFIPRITISPSDTDLPFALTRRQFPVRSTFL